MMPLFQFPTGHTKTAETMEANIREQYPNAVIETVDFLTYCQPVLEKFVAGFYMQWLKFAPKLYQSIYKGMMNDKYAARPKYKFKIWSLYFERKMKRLLAEKRPELIVCTHSFPSKVIGGLIEKDKVSEIPVINVYTDLFMNGVWASEGIKYHFVPHDEARNVLMDKHAIPAENIFVTGIPVHPAFTKEERQESSAEPHVLVAGGNTGLINVETLTRLFTNQPRVRFTVLCGKNEVLYNDLATYDFPQVTLMKYIDSPEEMNALYDEVDAIITKPGGVTMSEAILKQLPIFISHYLPGPEAINLTYLLENNMAQEISLAAVDKSASACLCDAVAMEKMMEKVVAFSEGYDCTVADALDMIVDAEDGILAPAISNREVNHPSLNKVFSI